MCDHTAFNIELPLPKTLVKKKKIVSVAICDVDKKKILKIVLKEKRFL